MVARRSARPCWSITFASLTLAAFLVSPRSDAASGSVSAGAWRGTPDHGQAPPAMQPLDIKFRTGVLTLMAPPGATAKLSHGTSIDVTAGPGFRLEINAGIGMLSRYKAELQDNTLNVLKRFVVDEPPLGIVYESTLAGKPEFHMHFIVKGVLGGLVCSDTRGPFYTEAQARVMYAACKTIALKS